jgi:hypothetical protein
MIILPNNQLQNNRKLHFSQKVDLQEFAHLDQFKGTELSDSHSIQEITKENTYHSAPKTIIETFGVEESAVLYGLAIILKNHKANYHDGKHWYFDSLEELIKKRWPYLKKSRLAELLNRLKDQEWLLIKNLNKSPYNRTSHYAMEQQRIKEVLQDTLYIFDVDTATRFGVLASLILHNIKYNCSRNSGKQFKVNLRRLGKTFNVSLSTVKRSIEKLVSENYLKKEAGLSIYSVKDLVADSEVNSSSNLDADFQIWTTSQGNDPSSNLDDTSSNLDKTGSNLDESGSNLEIIDIYEADQKQIRSKIRSAPLVLLNEMQNRTEELNHHSDHLIKGPETRTVGSNQSIIDPYVHLVHFLESPVKRPHGPEKGLLIRDQISHSGSAPSEPNLPLLKGERKPQAVRPMSLAKGKQVSLGRCFDLSSESSGQFLKVCSKNQEIFSKIKTLPQNQQNQIRNSILRTSILFLETLSVELKLQLIQTENINFLQSLIFDHLFDFVEQNGPRVFLDFLDQLGVEKCFQPFPVLELLTRSALLLRDNSNNKLHQFCDYELIIIFEKLTEDFGNLEHLQPKLKSLFFVFQLFKSKNLRIPRFTRDAKAVQLEFYKENSLRDSLSLCSEEEFTSLVRFFDKSEHLNPEWLFFIYLKCHELQRSATNDPGEFKEKWHAENFQNLDQFLNFFPKIQDQVELYDIFLDIPKPESESKKRFRNILNKSEEDASNFDRNARISQLKTYFQRVKREDDRDSLINFNYEEENDLQMAVDISKELLISPEDLVDMCVFLLGKSQDRLSTFYVRSFSVFELYHDDFYYQRSMLANNYNTDYQKMWKDYMKLAFDLRYPGQSFVDLLRSKKEKFPAWFRILATSEPSDEIISEFAEQARSQLYWRLNMFIRRSGLDIYRILDGDSKS